MVFAIIEQPFIIVILFFTTLLAPLILILNI